MERELDEESNSMIAIRALIYDGITAYCQFILIIKTNKEYFEFNNEK